MNRRRLLTAIVAGFSTIAAAGFAFPFLRSLFPGFRHEILLDVDVSGMLPGEVRRVRWLGRHVLVVRRSPEIEARLIQSDGNRADAKSEASRQPAFARNRLRSREAEHLLVYANCTHLGCEVEVMNEDGFTGFSCPCHRSRFDAAGRVEQGAAAKLNLEVPDYSYVARSVIRLKDV